MLHVFGVSLQTFHQAVVVTVRLLAELFVALQDDHRDAVGVRLVELCANAFRSNHCRRVLWRHRHRVVSRDRLDRRYQHVQGYGQQQPGNENRYGEAADKPRELRVGSVIAVHAAFTKQDVWAWCPDDVCSSLTTPLTVMRHPMLSLLPCATRLAITAGTVVVMVKAQGRPVKSVCSGWAFLSK
jgi:hypothetical protein